MNVFLLRVYLGMVEKTSVEGMMCTQPGEIIRKYEKGDRSLKEEGCPLRPNGDPEQSGQQHCGMLLPIY